MDKILVVEDTESLREVLCAVLTGDGFTVQGVASAEDALKDLSENDYSLVLSDLKLPAKSALDLLRESRESGCRVPVLVMTAYGSIDIAVQAMKLGAVDFITKPFDPGTLCSLIRQAIQHRRLIDRNGSGKRRMRQFITQNSGVEAMLKQARKVAPLASTVMIRGESGTGKELVARYIHEQSTRVEQPFVAVNCASMPGELLESEFFGHDAGAFTGATESRIGLFEVADKGTIFLDEIGNMPVSLQMKLLRTLQESEIKRLGSTKIQKVDTRVISATNSNIEEQISRGEFRDDLFYRLGVVVIEIPPLRERLDDIPLLTNYFIKSFSAEFGKSFRPLESDVIRHLQDYHWPGNVRELENVIERAMIFSDGTLTKDDFKLGHHGAVPQTPKTLIEMSVEAAKHAEVEAISRALAQTNGNKSRAAKRLGISYKTLLNKVKEYALDQKRSSTH